MIQSIFIQNFALINSLNLDLSKGMTILSGETGSGKSIILDAISLLCGKRSDRGSLLDKDKLCVLEATVIINKKGKNIFTDHNLDYIERSIIRREISHSGKNRCFINDNLVTLSVLNQFMSNLIDIYSQNYSISLKSEDKQLELIDKLSGSFNLLSKYQKIFTRYRQLSDEILIIKEGSQLSDMEIDFLNHQIQEIESLNLQLDEKDKLESDVKILENSKDIIESLSNAYQYLSNENGILSNLSKVNSEINSLSVSSPKIKEIKDRISVSLIELDDLSDSINSFNQTIEINPESLMEKSTRLDNINSLLVKHRKSTIVEILELLKQMKIKIQSSLDFEEIILDKKNQLNKIEIDLNKASELLTKSRKSIFPNFKKNIETYLKKLGIKDPVFNILLSDKDYYSNTGKDSVSFMFSANKGTDPAEIHKVASGGELSRLMLCISYLLSEVDDVSSIIFDEIDAGVSGEIASLMSDMMKRMSKEKQIISVTHLPQIASNGDTHFKVYKKDSQNRTITQVKELVYDDRVHEIAKMLSGKKVTDISISNAKELLTT